MAQIDDELAKLKQTKADIAKSITDKGGVLENPSDFSSYNLSIDKLSDFSVIGYDSAPDVFINQINYSKSLMNGTGKFGQWLFQSNKQIYYFPAVNGNRFPESMEQYFISSNISYIPPMDLTHVTTFMLCFVRCPNLQYFDFSLIKVNNDADFRGMFSGCEALLRVTFPTEGFAPVLISSMFENCGNVYIRNLDKVDFSRVTDISYFLRDADNISELPEMNTSNCTNFESMLGYNRNIDIIQGLDISKGESIILCRDIDSLYNLQYMLLKGVGANPNLTRIVLNWSGTMWGAERDVLNARQSLVDTLITYSADRTGQETATIVLRSAVKNRLTADEIALIEAKNYIIEVKDDSIG